MTTPLLIGCVADDYTGASDAASFIAKRGLKTILSNGIPAEALPEDCQAVVIGMKTRSIPAAEAAAQTVSALTWLRRAGAEQLYLKYCSTFDSTPAGNIGPTVDAAMKLADAPYTLLCPSLPVNGRTVQGGRLYVHGVPLAESPMKDHPLNPMWASDIGTLMAPQGAYDCLVLDGADLEEPEETLRAKLSAFGRDRDRFYVVPDYETDAQGIRIARLFGDLPLLTGGSGLLEHLAAEKQPEGASGAPSSGTAGPGIALCGSCSKATGEQISRFRRSGRPCLAVDPEKLLSGEQTIEKLWAFAAAHPGEDVLLYSVGAERTGGDPAHARLLEDTMAQLGRRALDSGCTRIVVAGGETSGAVMVALGMSRFYIGDSVAPGVPMMTPVERPEVRIVLKSGNFGQPDFFARALAMTKGEL